jgi:NAD+ kinase
MEVHTGAGVHTHLAINEVSLLRQTHQAAKMSISINNKIQMEEFMGDGMIISTPAGSPAYNRSAGGPIIPLGVPLLSIMPLCPLKPKGWHGALIDDKADIILTIKDPNNRMISACADYINISHAHKVHVSLDSVTKYTLLFDKGHNLEERIVAEQFK